LPSKLEGGASYDTSTKRLTVRRVLHRSPGRTYETITSYDVQILDPDPSIGAPAVRLIQADGSSYDVIRRPFGWTCECKDWLTRRVNSGEPCKHIAAVTKAGVLPALAPWVPCRCCDNFWCTVHQRHVHDCPCPPIEEWETDPYSAEGDNAEHP
jgi:hypothetical protein